MTETIDLKKYLRDIPDFPKPGILFKDITTLLIDSVAFNAALDQMEAYIKPLQPDVISGIESRGFIFGAPLADRLHLPFVPIRKKGKLPADTLCVTYDLEYGSDTIEVHRDAVKKGDRYVIVDDLLATGGTAAAAAELIESGGGIVENLLFLVELADLAGRDRLKEHSIHSLLIF
jgi:adenine phosphoribosyltransferase